MFGFRRLTPFQTILVVVALFFFTFGAIIIWIESGTLRGMLGYSVAFLATFLAIFAYMKWTGQIP